MLTTTNVHAVRSISAATTDHGNFYCMSLTLRTDDGSEVVIQAFSPQPLHISTVTAAPQVEELPV